MTAHRPEMRTSPDDQRHHAAEPAQQDHYVDNGEHKAARGEQPDNRVSPVKEGGETGQHRGVGPEILLDRLTDKPEFDQPVEEERPGLDRSIIVFHGARALLVTLLVIIMTSAALAIAPHVRLPRTFVPLAYIAIAALTHPRCRSAASGGVVPLGAHGDSRFMLAVVAATGLAITPPETPILAMVPLILLIIVAALCGAADGAWTTMAMRHHGLTFVQALRTFLSAAGSPGACSWRIVRGGRP